MGFFGPLVSGVSNLLGGIMSSRAASDAAEEQAALQKEFAQNAIQWKVADAKAAGVHPLYALGANTVSYSPVSVGDTSMGSAFSNMGQDVGRAIEAVQSEPERTAAKQLTALQLERAGLENEFLKTQIAGQINRNVRSAQVGPGMPLVERVQGPQRTTGVNVGGVPVPFDQGTSDVGQIIEDRYGEGNPLTWPMGAATMWNDFVASQRGKSIWQILRDFDRWTSISKYDGR